MRVWLLSKAGRPVSVDMGKAGQHTVFAPTPQARLHPCKLTRGKGPSSSPKWLAGPGVLGQERSRQRGEQCAVQMHPDATASCHGAEITNLVLPKRVRAALPGLLQVPDRDCITGLKRGEACAHRILPCKVARPSTP